MALCEICHMEVVASDMQGPLHGQIMSAFSRPSSIINPEIRVAHKPGPNISAASLTAKTHRRASLLYAADKVIKGGSKLLGGSDEL